MDYYNEIDEGKCDWLAELMRAGVINRGVIDNRSIKDVVPSDLQEFNQCHFFAGIGVWPYVVKKSGWGERKLWTGSCPCQPFSTTGKRGGFDDERHLWPDWNHLISICNPDIVLGEQVESKDGYAWLDLVWSDMEAQGYTFGAVDTAAAGFGAPEIRQRFHFVGVGNAIEKGLQGHGRNGDDSGRRQEGQAGSDSAPSPSMRLADYYFDGRTAERRSEREYRQCYAELGWSIDGLDHTDEEGQWRWELQGPEESGGKVSGSETEQRVAGRNISPSGESAASPTNGFWRSVDWLYGRDDKWRAVRPRSFPLANGTPVRVLRLCGYGDAIVAPQAEEFVRSVRQYVETIESGI